MYSKKPVQKTNVQHNPSKCTAELLSPIIILGECFGLLPVTVTRKKGHNSYRFGWISFRVVYAVVIFILTALVASMCLYQLVIEGATLTRAVDTGFYTSASLGVLLFIVLAKDWPQLMQIWSTVDTNMERVYGFPKYLHRKLKYTAIFFMFLSAVEHVLYLTYQILDCQKYGKNCTASFHYQKAYSQIFNYVNYSPILAVLLQIIHLGSTFTWNYNNLFIILISIILTERFKQITARLKDYEKFKFVDSFWSTVREDYYKLCHLCYSLDSYLAYLILLSYGTNLFFILIQLYNSLMKLYQNMEKLYFCYSFGFLIFRTIAVSLYAASVNDASKEPVTILHSVPTTLYNDEIKRLLHQISFDGAVLTGCKMFKITRGLILHIAGAIVTYELVLVQFNAIN